MWCWSPPRATTGSHMSCATGEQSAPAPKSPEELSRIGADREMRATSAAGLAPPPMEIAQLLGSSVDAVPAPQDIGAFTVAAGPPAPRPLEELGLVASSAPMPMSLEQLEAPTRPYGGESGPASGGPVEKNVADDDAN